MWFKYLHEESEPGTYYEKALRALNKLSFFGVELDNKSGRNIQQPIDPKTFYSQLAASMKAFLLESSDKNIVQPCDVVIPEKWTKEFEKNIMFGGKEIRTLTNKFHLNERHIIRGLRVYVVDKKVPKKITSALQYCPCPIAVSTSERMLERIFADELDNEFTKSFSFTENSIIAIG